MMMTVQELYEQVRDGKIISDISLQREIVYNLEKQQLVIDSIVNGVPLPAFYLWRNENGILEVLDGKQRIREVSVRNHPEPPANTGFMSSHQNKKETFDNKIQA